MVYMGLLYSAIEDLYKAVKKADECGKIQILSETIPFHFCDQVVWPADLKEEFSGRYVSSDGVIYILEDLGDRIRLTHEIIDVCNGDPQKILFAVRRIRAAADWCLAEVEGGEHV